MRQTKLVIINHSRIKRANRSSPLAIHPFPVNRQRDIQMQHSAHIINPRNTLQTQRLLAKRIHPHSRYTVLNGLLKDIRLGDLDERWMNGRGLLHRRLPPLLRPQTGIPREPPDWRFMHSGRINGVNGFVLRSSIQVAVDDLPVISRVSDFYCCGIQYFR